MTATGGPRLGRRALLSGLAALIPTTAGAAVLGTSTVPARNGAPQIPLASENPALIELGRELEQTAARFFEARRIKEAALERFKAVCPTVPDDLVLKGGARIQYSHLADGEVDIEDKPVWPPPLIDAEGRAFPVPRRQIMNAHMIRPELERLDGRTREARQLAQWLAVATSYESAIASAKEDSGAAAAIDECYFAATDLEKTAHAMRDVRAVTAQGLVLKARAAIMCADIGTQQRHLAAVLIGPSLAVDIVQVLGSEAVSADDLAALSDAA